jgi:hypothetical protein
MCLHSIVLCVTHSAQVTETYYVTNATHVPPFTGLSEDDLRALVYQIRSVQLNFGYINVAAGVFGKQGGGGVGEGQRGCLNTWVRSDAYVFVCCR